MESTARSCCTLPCQGLKLLAAFVGARKAPTSSTVLMRRFVKSLLCWNLLALSWRTLNSVANCFSTSSGAPHTVLWRRALQAEAICSKWSLHWPPLRATRVARIPRSTTAVALRSSVQGFRGQLPVQRGKLIAQVGRDHKVLVVLRQLLRGTPTPSWRSCSAEVPREPPGQRRPSPPGHTSSSPACSG